MQKLTRFFWGWTEYKLQPDTTMTRARAALLIRSWRKGRFIMKRIGKGHYQVAAPGYATEHATMIIQVG